MSGGVHRGLDWGFSGLGDTGASPGERVSKGMSAGHFRVSGSTRDRYSRSKPT